MLGHYTTPPGSGMLADRAPPCQRSARASWLLRCQNHAQFRYACGARSITARYPDVFLAIARNRGTIIGRATTPDNSACSLCPALPARIVCRSSLPCVLTSCLAALQCQSPSLPPVLQCARVKNARTKPVRQEPSPTRTYRAARSAGSKPIVCSAFAAVRRGNLAHSSEANRTVAYTSGATRSRDKNAKTKPLPSIAKCRNKASAALHRS
jgi:hypothetical protein